MRRILEPLAYSDDPIRNCWWHETAPEPDWITQDGDATCDVAIIGAGFTGLSAALHLAEAGAQAIVLDAKTPGWGASGRNGGFCCEGGSKLSGDQISARYGPDALNDWRQVQIDAVDLVADLLDRHGINADRHSQGETLLAHRPKDWTTLQQEAEALTTETGATPDLIPAQDLAKHGLNGPFYGALTTPVGFALNPRKYVLGLAQAAQTAGATIRPYSPVIQINGPGPYRLTTPNGTITANKIIIATNGYSSEDIPPWLRSRTMPVQSAVIVTRPITTAEQMAQGWTSGQMCYDTRSLLHYWRLMPDGRMLFGMRGGLFSTARSDARIARKIRADFDAMFPEWSHIDTPHRWSGYVCLTRSQHPYVGAVPGLDDAYIGFGYHGNGVAMGSYAGKTLAELALGRRPARYPATLSTPPARFPLGRLRRWLMAPAYVALAMADR